MRYKKAIIPWASIFRTSVLLIIVMFLFNFNFDIFNANADVGQVIGTGTPGYIPKWVTPTGTVPSFSTPPTTCTIASGQSSCNSTITWTVTNPVGATTITASSTVSPASPYNALPASGGSQVFTVNYNASGVTFTLTNNGASTQSVVPTSCASGTSWNGSVCAPSAGSVTISANGTPVTITITTGGSAVLTWDSPVGTSSCVGTADVGTWDTGGAPSNTSPGVTVNPTTTTVYTVTCDGTSAQVTVVVKRKPSVIEN